MLAHKCLWNLVGVYGIGTLNTYATTIDMRNSHCIFSLRHAKTVPSQLHPTPIDLAGDGKNAGTEQRHLQHLRNKLLDAHLASHFLPCHRVKKHQFEPQK